MAEPLRIHTINLDRRIDRWLRCLDIQRETPDVEFVRSRAPELPGRAWLACAWSHQIAVYDAKVRNDPFVIVAEDDVELTPAFSAETLRQLIAYADVVGLGCLQTGTVSYAQEIVRTFTPDNLPTIAETCGPLSSQLAIYLARGYDAVLSWPCGWGSDYGADPCLPGELHERMRCSPPTHLRRGLTVPFLSIQRDDFSDNCGRRLELAQHWRDAEESWQRALRLGTNRVA